MSTPTSLSAALDVADRDTTLLIGRAWIQILDALDGARDEEQLIARALPPLGTLVPFDAATLWRKEGQRLVVVAAQGFAEDESPVGLQVDIADSRIFQDITATRRTLYVPDVAQDERFPKGMAMARRSWLGVPVQSGDEILGLLILEARAPKAFQKSHLGLLHGFARLLGQYWQQHRTLTQLREERNQAQRLAQRLELLHEVIRDLTSTLDQRRIWARATHHLREALQAYGVTALTQDGRGQVRVEVEFPPTDDEYAQDRPVPLRPLFQFLGESERLMHVADPAGESMLRAAEAFFRARHKGHTLIVPVADEERLYGAFLVWASEPFQAERMELARTLAQQTAAGLRNARLYHITRQLTTHLEQQVEERTAALRAEHRRAQLMAQIFAELAGSLDMDQVLSRTLDTLLEGLDATQGVVLHIPPHDPGRIVWRAGRGPRQPEYGGQDVPLSPDDPWLRRLTREHETLLIGPETPWPPGWVELFGQYPNGVAVPLLLGAEAHGVLLLLRAEPKPWQSADVELVQATAMQMATVIQNASVVELLHQQVLETSALSRERQIEASRMRAILEAVADGILVTDPKGRVTLVNPSALRLLGLSEEELLGQPLERYRGLFGAQGQAWLEHIRHWSQHPEDYTPGESAASQIELEDGRVLAIHLAPVFMRRRFLGTVSVIRDITHHIEVDRMKSEFVATVSHELRTPLTAIKGYVDLLTKPHIMGELNPKQAHAIEVIQRHVRRLITLVNDLLTLSRLESGRMRITPQVMELAPILAETVEEFHRQMQEQQRDLAVHLLPLPEDLPPVYADPQRVRQIVGNLVENACRYTPDGGQVTVEARTQNGFVQVSVRDTGIGIRPEDLGRVFERFYRGEHPLVMKTAGTGLGLAIVKQLVEMHGGRIWVESTGVPGEGSTFHFTLPIARPEVLAAAEGE